MGWYQLFAPYRKGWENWWGNASILQVGGFDYNMIQLIKMTHAQWEFIRKLNFFLEIVCLRRGEEKSVCETDDNRGKRLHGLIMPAGRLLYSLCSLTYAAINYMSYYMYPGDAPLEQYN
jgi:hypothetical protein